MIDPEEGSSRRLPVPPARPPGAWERETSYPAPLTPFDSGWLLPAHNRASKAAFTELSSMLDRVELCEIDGYVYRQIVFFGSGGGPVPLKPLARALFRLRPATAGRLAGALLSIEGRAFESTVRRWTDEWKPRVKAELTSLADVDSAALSDLDVDRLADRLVRLSLDAHGAALMAITAASILLGRFERSCLVSLSYDAGRVQTILDSALARGEGEQSDAAASARASLPETARFGFDEQWHCALDATEAIGEAQELGLRKPLLAGRRLASELGRRLAERGRLSEAEDARLFTMDELRAALRVGSNLTQQAATRREAQAAAAARTPAERFGEQLGSPSLDRYPVEVRRMTEALLAHADLLSGSAVHPS